MNLLPAAFSKGKGSHLSFSDFCDFMSLKAMCATEMEGRSGIQYQYRPVLSGYLLGSRGFVLGSDM